MSGQIESALVLSLVDSIKWESALGPTGETGVMTTVAPEAPLDVTKYARRDRELAYRDLINAAAVLKVSLEIETVFNSTPIRPKVEGLTTEIMPDTRGDLGLVNSQVVHVKNSSLPIDALAVDKDLAGRDALLYEVLSRACQVFSDPPLTPNDANGTLIPGVTAWSQAQGLSSRSEINPALPLSTDTFKLPDRNLAERDNQIAAYVSRLVQVLKNPFAFADRLYVKIDNVDERELEIFSLIRVYWDSTSAYLTDDEVYHGTSWWKAAQNTSLEPMAGSTAWIAIATQTERIYQADPNMLGRNRIVYNTALKTLKWISEHITEVHVPQIYALSIPGPQIGQFVTTVPAIPEAKDAEFWRMKAGRITYEGTLATHLEGFHNTAEIQTGVTQSDTTGLTGPGELVFPFTVDLEPHLNYRFSALVKPSQEVSILGAYNQIGLSGTMSGLTFSGGYAPTVGVAGSPVPFAINLPPGGWELTLQYTDLNAVTDGFGTKITNNGISIMEDAAPLLFQNQNGVKYSVGQLLESNPIIFTSTGGINNINIQWTYGDGLLHVRSLTFASRDRKIGRYSMRVDVHDNNGNSVISDVGTLIPTVDTWGERDIYGVMPFEFVTTQAISSPEIEMKWLPEDNQLPIQVRQVHLERVDSLDPIPEFGGFLSWKQECLYRAVRAVNTAYSSFVSNTSDLPDFTIDGTLWDKTSTESWMQAIETYHPRLRSIACVTTINDGKKYDVIGGYVVYNGGTYSDGQTFYGTTVGSLLNYGSQVDQRGAFTLSFPGHIGKPALLPLGLYYNNTNAVQANSTTRMSPVLSVCQPWMIEAGIYVAHPDFWSPETITTGLEINNPSPPRYPDTFSMTTGFKAGSYDSAVYVELGAMSASVWTGSLASVIDVTSGGTHSGTVGIEIWTGSLASVVDVISGGTHSGTVGIEIWTGSLASVVDVISGGTHSGTVGIEIWTGSLVTTSVSGGAYTEYGTMTVGFYSGDYYIA
jgi:hypothetical protein